MPERTINFGADRTDATYSLGDDDANSRFIVAEDTDAGTVLLEYDETAGEFVYRGPVNMNSNDLSNVGALDATSVSTDSASIAESASKMSLSSAQTLNDGTEETVLFDTSEFDRLNGVDTSNNEITVPADGTYSVVCSLTFQRTDFSGVVVVDTKLNINGSEFETQRGLITGSGNRQPGFVNDYTVELSANDTISIKAIQSGGTDIQIWTDGPPTLSVTRTG